MLNAGKVKRIRGPFGIRLIIAPREAVPHIGRFGARRTPLMGGYVRRVGRLLILSSH